MPALVPSLDACRLQLAGELTRMVFLDEGLDEIMTDADQGAVYISTDSDHEHGITIFGFVSEGE